MSVPGEFNQAIIQYVSDTGQIFSVSQKRSTAIAVGNLLLPVRGQQGIPERWRLRTITAVTIYGGKYYKRRIVIGSVNNPVFTGARAVIFLDGVVWRILSRDGESMRGPKLAQ